MVYLGGEKNTENDKKSLKTGNSYHVTGTIGSNLTYLATPGQVSMGVDLFIGSPVMPQKFVPIIKLILAMSKCIVSMATHNAILLNGGTYKNNHISAVSQSRLSLVPN